MTKRKESLIHLESSCSVLGPGGRKPVTHSVRSAGSFHRCGEQGCLEKTWTQPVGVGGILEKPFQAQSAAQAEEARWGSWRRVSSVSRGDQISPSAMSKHSTAQRRERRDLFWGLT